MRLYYVRADDDNGENADMYAWAFTPQEAAKLCQQYWKDQNGGKLSDTNVSWVDEVPHNVRGPIGVVEWDNVVRHEETGATK